MGDREEWQALAAGARPLHDAQHHIDEYAESLRIKMRKATLVDYRSPERLKYSI
jgi:hypothetical protein